MGRLCSMLLLLLLLLLIWMIGSSAAPCRG